MVEYLFDVVFVAVALATALAVSRFGGVRAALWFIGIVLSSIVMLNLFEPLSQILIRYCVRVVVEATWPYARFLSLLILFFGCLGLVQVQLSRLLPDDPEMPPNMERFVCWCCGALSGYVVAAFLIVAAHTFPAKPDFAGYFASDPQDRRGPVMRFAPDHHLLKLVQVASGEVFPIGENGALFPAELPQIGEETDDRWASFPRRYQTWRKRIETERVKNETNEAENDEGNVIDGSIDQEPPVDEQN